MPYIPPHIQALKPYQSARDLYQGDYLFMDANENCFGPLVGPKDRFNEDGSSKIDVSGYPDTDLTKLRGKLSDMYGIDKDEVAIFNGSDASIPEILVTFSDHGANVAGLDVGFGMYRSFCEIHGRNYVGMPTDENFTVDRDNPETEQILKNSQICFLDVPNNPSGCAQSVETIEWMIEKMNHGVFVLDLAYFGFIDDDEEGKKIKAFVSKCTKRENVLVMYSFSKTWCFAGGRLGAVFGSKELISQLIKVRIPYHVSVTAESLGLAALAKEGEMKRRCRLIREYRDQLTEDLNAIELSDPRHANACPSSDRKIFHVHPSQANFLLVKFPKNSREIFDRLVEEYNIVLRYFGGGDALAGKDSKLAHCVRITVGLPEQNKRLIRALKLITGS